MFRGSFRSLRHPLVCRSAGQVCGASTSVLEDGQGPAPAREFASDRGVRDDGALLAGFELVPAVVEASVAQVAAGSGGWGGEVPAVADRLARHVAVLMMPGGLDQQPAGMTVAGLGDRAERARLARGVLRGDQANEGADRVTGEPALSPISTARANPVNVEIPRRQPSLRTTSVYWLFSAMAVMRSSRRSRRAVIVTTLS